MSRHNVGILGIGVHLPEKVRTNGDWPASFKERFSDRRATDITTPDLGMAGADELVRDVLQKYEDDPFRGAVERRVLDQELLPSDMEAEAARRALENANVPAADIDLLIVSSSVPNLTNPPNVGLLHLQLGLRKSMLTLSVDSSCSSFLPAMLMATGQISAGMAKRALLVQSAAFSRVLEYDRPMSVNFGDGATAVVVGEVSEGRGILGTSFFNDGRFYKAAVVGDNGGAHWWEGKGPQQVTSLDLAMGKTVSVRLGLLAQEASDAALSDAGLSRSDVSFFAAHQPTRWFNELCVKTAGLSDARTATTFERTASVGQANVPLNLDAGVRQKLLRDDDVALLYSCGGGMNWGAIALRWGR